MFLQSSSSAGIRFGEALFSYKVLLLTNTWSNTLRLGDLYIRYMQMQINRNIELQILSSRSIPVSIACNIWKTFSFPFRRRKKQKNRKTEVRTKFNFCMCFNHAFSAWYECSAASASSWLITRYGTNNISSGCRKATIIKKYWMVFHLPSRLTKIDSIRHSFSITTIPAWNNLLRGKMCP